MGNAPLTTPREESKDRLSALGTYLNDHLAGATLGLDHARQLEQASEGTPFGAEMARTAREIEEDRETLIAIMDALGTSRNPVKAATAWVAEKAGRVKFSGATSGDRELGRYLALEAMSLGVEGKKSLWQALARIAPGYPALASFDFDRLIGRAQSQRGLLEDERMRLAGHVIGSASEPS